MDRIFVAIASYRDPECQHTVADLFAQAAHPERITVGTCWQFDPQRDDDCFQVESPYPYQTRIKSYDWRNSKGGCWARAEALSLLEDEDYVLQLDAHMRFVKGWDEKMIEMIRRAPQPKAALSTMALNYDPPRILQEMQHSDDVPVVRAEKIAGPGDLQPVSLAGWIRRRDNLTVPGLQPSPFIVANFLFAPARMFREVPYDPHIYFRGQELTYSMRVWTHGYDIWQPDQIVIYHYWKSPMRTDGAMPGYKQKTAEALRARKRVWHLIGVTPADDPAALAEIEKYGMGHARSIEDYWKFSGIDLRTGKLEQKASHSRWQPFES